MKTIKGIITTALVNTNARLNPSRETGFIDVLGDDLKPFLGTVSFAHIVDEVQPFYLRVCACFQDNGVIGLDVTACHGLWKAIMDSDKAETCLRAAANMNIQEVEQFITKMILAHNKEQYRSKMRKELTAQIEAKEKELTELKTKLKKY